MSKLDPWYEARERMVDAVIADLYGSSSDELLTEPPLDRFVVGILHPTIDGGLETAELANEQPDSEAGTAPDADFDPGVSLAYMRYPSTIGLTFGLAAATQRLEIQVEAERYELIAEDVIEDDHEVGARVQSGPKGTWRRVAVAHPTTRVDVIDDGRLAHIDVADGLALRVMLRPTRDGMISSTVVLQNTFPRPEKGGADAVCWFRPVIRVRAFDGEFVDRRRSDYFVHLDDDERSGELLYREQHHLAIGHGVAVTWVESDVVTEMVTTFFHSMT